MRKHIFVSARRLQDKCIYAATITADAEIIGSKCGEFHLQRPNKACLYTTDVIELEERKTDNERVYSFETIEATKYVGEMRKNLKISLGNFSGPYFENNEKLIKGYIDKNFPIFKQLDVKDLDRW